MDVLLGAGQSRNRWLNASRKDWHDLVTVDFNPAHKPDVEWDLEKIPLPFSDNSVDEIHAYEVLEHTGNQGDFRFLFAQFSDFWRILKPNGYIMATVPQWDSIWAWGDPSHKRIINLGTLAFLSQKQYGEQVGKTQMTDYRFIYKADFEIFSYDTVNSAFRFILKAIK